MSPDGLGEHPMALRSRMNAIGLIQFRDAGHTLEKERDQCALICTGDLGKNGRKRRSVDLAEIRGGLHSRDQESSFGIVGPRAVDDRLQVGLHGVRRQTSKSVIGSELEDQNLNRSPEKPSDSPKPPSAGVSTDPGVDHLEGKPGGIREGLDLIGEAVHGILETQAGGQARAEEYHPASEAGALSRIQAARGNIDLGARLSTVRPT